MPQIITREVVANNATTLNVPLTNSQLDNNFVTLNTVANNNHSELTLIQEQLIRNISGLVGYWSADPAYLFEDSAGTIPASVGGVVGCVRNLLSAPVYTPVTIANSDFELGDDGSWTKGTGWTIGSGVATKTAGTASALSHSVSVTPGTTYLLTVTTSISAGWITPRLTGGTTNTSAAISTSGTSERTFVALTGNNVLDFYATDIFAGTVDNVTLVAVSNAPALQATTANKSYLRKTPTSNVYWLDSNTANSALTATLGNLGSACTVASAGAEGVTFTEGVTISSTYNIAPAYSFNGDVAIFNRALTTTEKALLTRYMSRGVPVLGSNIFANSGFDTDTAWTKGTGWSIADGVATFAGGTNSYLAQSKWVAGKIYHIKFDVVAYSGANPAVSVYAGNSPTFGTLQIANGTLSATTYRYAATCPANNGFLFYGSGAAGTTLSFDNASAMEIL